MEYSKERRQQALVRLLAASDFDTMREFLAFAVADSVCPAVCMDCGYITETEPDQEHGWCPECGKINAVSALVLAGLV